MIGLLIILLIICCLLTSEWFIDMVMTNDYLIDQWTEWLGVRWWLSRWLCDWSTRFQLLMLMLKYLASSRPPPPDFYKLDENYFPQKLLWLTNKLQNPLKGGLLKFSFWSFYHVFALILKPIFGPMYKNVSVIKTYDKKVIVWN